MRRVAGLLGSDTKGSSRCAAGILLAAYGLGVSGAGAQVESPPLPQVIRSSAPFVAARGPHHKTWAQVVASTEALGRERSKTNTYTELQTGLSFLDPTTGLWADSDP